MVLNEDDKKNHLLDSALTNRQLVLENLIDYVNALCKIWKKSIEKKPASVEWWGVSLAKLSTPNKSKCQECLEKLVMMLEQLSQTKEDPLQFKTYLDAFVKFAIDTTIFQGTDAENTFALLVMYLKYNLESDLKKTTSIELTQFKRKSLN